ncbi:MAG: Arylsulfatase [Firmicutes bacterium ADurb.Bin193]|nr:MAG: Arylsulfatase [Firmicutes bacterium ADurb.Bin193]
MPIQKGTGEKYSNSELSKFKKVFSKKGMMVALSGACLAGGISMTAAAADKPNILWITAEDLSPFIGCYGDTFAVTPNIDALANAEANDGTKEGLVFTNAFSNAPICSPARTTIITGIYANALGAESHRSSPLIPSYIEGFPKYLKDNGYMTYNNSKTDYNIGNSGFAGRAWTGNSSSAHYYDRPVKTKPFFQVYNIAITHESKLFTIGTNKVDKSVPYLPDNDIFKRSWGQEYANIHSMDSKLGGYINKLKAEGEWDNTIVFFYGDNGGVMPGMKRYPHDRGTRVPFVVRIPKKFHDSLLPADLKASLGGTTDRLISFVDLAPTILNLVGADIPEYMQGKPFMGSNTQTNEYIFNFVGRADERFECIRAVINKKYDYVRNYYPFLPHMQFMEYPNDQPAYASMWAEFRNGTLNSAQLWYFSTKSYEELYDLEKDPYEINNLANDPNYYDILNELRGVMDNYQNTYRDVGLVLPEEEILALGGSDNAHDVVNAQSFPYARIKETAEMAASGNEAYLPELIARLSPTEHSSVRYWAAIGCYIHKDTVKNDSNATDSLKACLTGCDSLKLAAARVLMAINIHKADAEATLHAALSSTNYLTIIRAVNILEEVAPVSEQLVQAVQAISGNFGNDPNKLIQRVKAYISNFNDNPTQFIKVPIKTESRDSGLFNIFIEQSNISFNDGVITGGIDLNIVNDTGDAVESNVILAVYRVNEAKEIKLIDVYVEPKILNEGDNLVEFNGLNITTETGGDLTFKVMTFGNPLGLSLTPLTNIASGTIQ